MDDNQHSKHKNNIVLENRYGSDWKNKESNKDENIKKFKLDNASKVGYEPKTKEINSTASTKIFENLPFEKGKNQ